MSWFKTGSDARSYSETVDKEAQQKRDKIDLGAWRFRLNSGESALIVVLDEGEQPSFFLSEHSMFGMGAGLKGFETCIKDSDDGPCPLCDIKGPSYGLALTILDTREWEDKNGKKHKNQKRVLVARGKARERWLARAEDQKFNLRGCVFKVSRGQSPNEASVGEDIQFMNRRLSNEQLLKLVPLGNKEPAKHIKGLGVEGYKKFFAPKSAQTLRQMIGARPPVGSVDDIGPGDTGADEIGGTSIDDLV